MNPASPAEPLTLTIRRRFKASRQTIFNAWIDPDKIKRWLGSAAIVTYAELDVRVGGQFRIDMLIEGQVYPHTGVYHEVRPPEKLVFTWVSIATHYRSSLVTVELFERGDQTELVLTQEHLPNEFEVQRHLNGWTSFLGHLASFLNENLTQFNLD